MYHPILPFCFFTVHVASEQLKAFILRKKGLIAFPSTLGEHLLNRRLTFGLRQEDVATRLGTIREVYERWERDERKPVISEWPGILKFLGYYPAICESPADLVLRARRTLGLTQYAMGRKMSIIAADIRKWEDGTTKPPVDLLGKLQEMAETKHLQG